MVCGRGRGCCSGRLPSRFAFYRLGGGHGAAHESWQALPGMLTHSAHAIARRINSQIGFGFTAKEVLWDFFCFPSKSNLSYPKIIIFLVVVRVKSKLDFNFFQIGFCISSLIWALSVFRARGFNCQTVLSKALRIKRRLSYSQSCK